MEKFTARELFLIWQCCNNNNNRPLFPLLTTEKEEYEQLLDKVAKMWNKSQE